MSHEIDKLTSRPVFRLHTNQVSFACDIADVVRMMVPGSIVMFNDSPTTNAITINHNQYEVGGKWRDELEYIADNCYLSHAAERVKYGADPIVIKRFQKRAARSACYELLKRLTNVSPPWGSLTGIRPTKLYSEFAALSVTDPIKAFIDTFDVREDKARLLAEICAVQQPYLTHPPNMADVYIGIPYCPSRCVYCAFSATTMPSRESELDEYLDALFYEIDEAKSLIAEHSFRINAIFIGGGTPTSLDAGRLDALLKKVSEAFAGNSGIEFSLEAGRPETIVEDKLRAIKSYPVNRICINPQTFNDETLARMGRSHTTADVMRAFELARKYGFDNINSDIIMALPGETLADFENTLRHMRTIKPECLTLHAFSLKKASRIYQEWETSFAADQDEADAMSSAGETCARELGMVPYYLYRQKNTSGRLENVGYAMPDKICQYNLDMMEETMSIIALGAGGISKRVVAGVMPSGTPNLRIERSPNMMEPRPYIQRVKEMATRKRLLFSD